MRLAEVKVSLGPSVLSVLQSTLSPWHKNETSKRLVYKRCGQLSNIGKKFVLISFVACFVLSRNLKKYVIED